MGMTSEEAIKTLKENYCAMCAYGSQDMDSCDIRSCDNRDAIKALEQEPTTKNDLGVDTDKLIADCEKMSFDFELFGRPTKVILLDAVKNIVKELPSVTPQERKGHWIDDMCLGYHVSICSNCNWRGHGNTCLIYKPKYCPNCGAKMVELQESEDNNGFN